MGIEDRIDEQGRLVRTLSGRIASDNALQETFPIGIGGRDGVLVPKTFVAYHPHDRPSYHHQSSFAFLGKLPETIAHRLFSLHIVYPDRNPEALPVEQRLVVFTADGQGKPEEYVFEHPNHKNMKTPTAARDGVS